MPYVHFLNGKFVSEEKLLISPRDLGFTRGYAAFDYLRTYANHKPFKLAKNIDRLFNSASLIGLTIPWEKSEVTEWVLQTLSKNTTPNEVAIKIIVSGGLSATMLPPEIPTIMIIVDKAPEFPQSYYKFGTSLMSVIFTRYTPEAKTNNYIEGVKVMQLAHKTGAIEPLYYNQTQVFEGSTSNIFALIDGKFLTPKTHILNGITRQTLLEIVKLPMPFIVEDFSFENLMNAKEVFITSSNKKVLPVVKIDNTIIGDGKVGPNTVSVMDQFEKYISFENW